MEHGMSAFRDEFINTGDNDLWVGSWWDKIMYFGFPIMFSVLSSKKDQKNLLS